MINVFLKEKTYTVVMVDPDVPHHDTGEFYLHWMVVNIPVSIILDIHTLKIILCYSLYTFQGYLLKQGLGYEVGDTVTGKSLFF